MTPIDPSKQDDPSQSEPVTVGKIRTVFTPIATGQISRYGDEQQTKAAWFLELSAETPPDAIIKIPASWDEVLIEPEAFEQLEQEIESLPKFAPGELVRILDPAGAFLTSVLEFREDLLRIANMISENPERGHAASVLRSTEGVDPTARIVRPANLHTALSEPCLTYIKLQVTALDKEREQARSERVILRDSNSRHIDSRSSASQPLM